MSSVYTTVQGDTWDKIAYDQLDDHLLMDQLLQANLPLIDIAIFPAGVEITIPDVSDDSADTSSDSSLLPDYSAEDLPDDSDADDDTDYEEDPNVDTEDTAYDDTDNDLAHDGSEIDW